MENYNSMSSARVREKTGHDWAEWIQLLDKQNANILDHKEIVALVYAELPKSWWAQMVTVGYEQAKGLRVQNQNAQGFQISASKTFAQPLHTVYRAWDQHLSEWYDGPAFEITTNNIDKNIRGKFSDGSVFAAGFAPTQTGKTQLAVGQEKLASMTAGEQARTNWKRQLERLAEYLA